MKKTKLSSFIRKIRVSLLGYNLKDYKDEQDIEKVTSQKELIFIAKNSSDYKLVIMAMHKINHESRSGQKAFRNIAKRENIQDQARTQVVSTAINKINPHTYKGRKVLEHIINEDLNKNLRKNALNKLEHYSEAGKKFVVKTAKNNSDSETRELSMKIIRRSQNYHWQQKSFREIADNSIHEDSIVESIKRLDLSFYLSKRFILKKALYSEKQFSVEAALDVISCSGEHEKWKQKIFRKTILKTKYPDIQISILKKLDDNKYLKKNQIIYKTLSESGEHKEVRKAALEKIRANEIDHFTSLVKIAKEDNDAENRALALEIIKESNKPSEKIKKKVQEIIKYWAKHYIEKEQSSVIIQMPTLEEKSQCHNKRPISGNTRNITNYSNLSLN